ncbi:hypothetical protein I6E29_05590 [Arcanobacterium haemolyticum]|nr:hypothetical protein [Arcanobacterium haemolyticum]
MRTKRVAAMALVGAALLAGCSAHPGAAAVINGTDVPESTVDELAGEISSVGASRTNALNIALTVAAVEPVMEAYSADVTDEFKAQAYANCTQTLGVPVTAESVQTLQDYCFMQNLVTVNQDFTAEANAALTEASIKLSPRYGTGEAKIGFPDYLTTDNRAKASTGTANLTR